MQQKIEFKGKELIVFDSVYFPEEDSFLLAKHAVFQAGENVLDVGTGSGIQAVNAALQNAKVTAVDVNLEAVKNVKENAKRFAVAERIHAFESDLFAHVKERFDCIMFNPPYVVSADEGEESNRKWVALDGGVQGREVLDLFLETFLKHLNANGRILFVQNNVNGIEKTFDILLKQGVIGNVIARQKFFFEELLVIEASRND